MLNKKGINILIIKSSIEINVRVLVGELASLNERTGLGE
jgi:hypothetical protein